MKFVDEAEIEVASGHGGAGSISFHSEPYVPRGGPDGGDGGKGGDVILRATTDKDSLLEFHYKKKHWAEDGQAGSGSNQTGRSGKDLVIYLPAGTVVKSEKGTLITDLKDGEEFVFLKGGAGGRGNAFFKSSVQQAPKKAQKGLSGQSRKIRFELKLIADVGLIGFPNAGKSTLLSKMSAAKPRVANYPFTTLNPHLGVISYGDWQSFVAADLPGLIKGAHNGSGLGTKFLRHIERTCLFLHVIDVSQTTMKDPWEAYNELNAELKKHDQAHEGDEGYVPLSSRPQIVVLNKIDSADAAYLKSLKESFQEWGVNTIAVSAVTGEQLKELISAMGKQVLSGKKPQEDRSVRRDI